MSLSMYSDYIENLGFKFTECNLKLMANIYIFLLVIRPLPVQTVQFLTSY